MDLKHLIGDKLKQYKAKIGGHMHTMDFLLYNYKWGLEELERLAYILKVEIPTIQKECKYPF